MAVGCVLGSWDLKFRISEITGKNEGVIFG